MNSRLPPSHVPAAGTDADARAQAIVLRDVVMHGQVALRRPRAQTSASSGALPLAASDGAPQASPPAVTQAQPEHLPIAQVEEEARRRGYEEGFAKGSIEGRVHGDEEARKAAAQAAEKAARELEERGERMARDLQQQAQAAYQARVQVLDALIAGLPAQFEARLAAAEDDMLALCFEVVCRTLGESVARPDALRAQLAQAIGQLRGRRPAAIHLHPDDLALLRKHGEPAQDLPGGVAVQWVADANVLLGGCIVQSPEGGLDARFETQLDALRELLLQTRAAARGQGT